MTFTIPETALGWDEPNGLTARGTLIVLAGRGESASVYERFGRRISADAYRVRVIDDIAADPSTAADRVHALLADDSLPTPRVLVGSDGGSALALQLASTHPDSFGAVVVAGLPIAARNTAAGGEAELRSACPVHRRTLDDGSLVQAGALARPLPAELALPDAGSITLPVLAVHGDADVVSPLDEALPYYRELSDADILTVRGGRHDSLNDLSHRSVAASIVLFLERVRAGVPILDRLER
ncbi:MAG: hypothetical protein JWR36_1309 [Glaciihabitans sp.]|nr:hypothetical protein [Glaciihabitans sp.]